MEKGVKRSRVGNNKAWKKRDLSVCGCWAKLFCRNHLFLYRGSKRVSFESFQRWKCCSPGGCAKWAGCWAWLSSPCLGAGWCTYQISWLHCKWIFETIQARKVQAAKRASGKSLEGVRLLESSFSPHYMVIELWVRKELKIWRNCNQVRTCSCFPWSRWNLWRTHQCSDSFLWRCIWKQNRTPPHE